MEVKDIVIPYKNANSTFKLYALGDIHAGTIHCVEDDVKRKVNEIAHSPNTFWIGMGDYCEWITPKDKRFDPNLNSIAEWVEPDNVAHCQTEWLKTLFTPIKKKCLGLIYGNHENSIRIYNHDNVIKNLCDNLEVDNLGLSCFLRLFFRRENSNECHLVKGVFTHGAAYDDLRTRLQTPDVGGIKGGLEWFYRNDRARESQLPGAGSGRTLPWPAWSRRCGRCRSRAPCSAPSGRPALAGQR